MSGGGVAQRRGGTSREVALARQRAVRPDRPCWSSDHSFMSPSTASLWWMARSGPCTPRDTRTHLPPPGAC